MGMNHSDAPWRFDAVPHRAGHGIEGHILPHGAHDDDPSVAWVECVGSVDLALILAAPDLLAALIGAVERLGHDDDCKAAKGWCQPDACDCLVTNARAVIAKAEGGAS